VAGGGAARVAGPPGRRFVAERRVAGGQDPGHARPPPRPGRDPAPEPVPDGAEAAAARVAAASAGLVVLECAVGDHSAPAISQAPAGGAANEAGGAAGVVGTADGLVVREDTSGKEKGRLAVGTGYATA